MLETLQDYLPLIVWVLVIIAAILVMKISKRNDNDVWEQEDEDDNSISITEDLFHGVDKELLN